LAIHWTWARCVEFNHLFSRTHFSSNYRFVASSTTVLLFPPLPLLVFTLLHSENVPIEADFG